MATAMDEQLLEERSWSLQLQRGEEITLIPWDDQPFLLTHVFLVDPESVAGQGVVTACVEMGTRNIMLAKLSSETTDVELETPVVLHDKFCFYVVRQGGGSDADTDSYANEDAVVVQFEGLVFPLNDDEDSDEEEDGNEEVESSEDDGDKTDEEYEEEDKESNGEVD